MKRADLPWLLASVATTDCNPSSSVAVRQSYCRPACQTLFDFPDVTLRAELYMGDAHPVVAARTDQPQWYALHTRAKHEMAVGTQLRSKGVQSYIPSIKEVHRWSDRSKTIEVPLFSCYVFVHDIFSRVQLPVLHTPGVLRWVGASGEPAVIPESQMHAVQTLVQNHAPVTPYPFVEIGERVRIRDGSLNGVEGILVGRKGERKLVVSINLIQHAVAMTIDGYDVEPV